jgi:predicted GTPase
LCTTKQTTNEITNPKNTNTASINARIKKHKEKDPILPAVNSIQAQTYKLAKFLALKKSEI